MARFDRQIETAIRLIKKNGQKVVWKQPNNVDVVDKPWEVTPGVPTQYEPFICFLPISKENRQFIRLLGGQNEVSIGSVLGLMGNVAFEPSLSDWVERDGKRLELLSIDLLAPNGQKILWTMEFK